MVSGYRNSRFCAGDYWIAATKMTSNTPSSLRRKRCACTQMSAHGSERQRSRRESRRADFPRTDRKRPAKFTAIKSSTQDSLGNHSRTGDSVSAFLPLEGFFVMHPFIVTLFSTRCPHCRSIGMRSVGSRNAFERALSWIILPYRCGLCDRHRFLFRWQTPTVATASELADGFIYFSC